MHKPTPPHTLTQALWTQSYLGVLLLSMLWSSAAWSLDAYTERKVRLAAVQCEHALAVQPPKTDLALRVLQRYFKKYTLYRDAATERDPNVWSSDEQHSSGKRFANQSYSEILSLCERELPLTMQAAEKALQQYQAEQAALRQQHAQTAQQAQQQALQQVKLAISDYCQSYLRKPVSTKALDETAKTQLNQAYAAYTQARKEALALSADIQQAEFSSFVQGTKKQQFLPKKQTVGEWFDYCEMVFAEHLSQTVEAEGPPAPNNETQTAAKPASVEEKTAAQPETTQPTPIPAAKEQPAATSTVAKVDAKAAEKTPTAEKAAPVSKDSKPIVAAKDKEVTTASKETPKQEAPIAVKKEEAKTEKSKEASKEKIDVALETNTNAVIPPKKLAEELKPKLAENKPAKAEPKPVEKEPEAEPEVEPEAEAETEINAAPDAAGDGVDEEYAEALKKAKDDRAQILKKEKRSPEYLDEGQENVMVSKEWFYEDYDSNDNPKSCRIYTFNGNKLKAQDSFEGPCFEQ